MNCEQYEEYTSRFIDGELEIVSETELFKHLGTCEQCRNFLKEALNLRSELSNSRILAVPKSLDQRVKISIDNVPSRVKPVIWNFFKREPRRMFSLRAVGFALVITILTSVAITSLWYHSNVISKETVVYVPMLPTVEVQGYLPSSSTQPN
jgi:predicted anti-sigma-YlaC factor YlaD